MISNLPTSQLGAKRCPGRGHNVAQSRGIVCRQHTLSTKILQTHTDVSLQVLRSQWYFYLAQDGFESTGDLLLMLLVQILQRQNAKSC